MNKLFIEPSPHIRSKMTTQKIMLHVIIALLPTLAAATYIYGVRALVTVVVCAASCVIFELLFELITKRPRTISDLSAVVTGMLLAYNLPPTIPLYMAVIGCFFAIVVTKQFFGGIGQNFANPAIVGRIVMILSFTSYMTSWSQPFFYNQPDAVTTATPLACSGEQLPSLFEMFFVKSGCIGECCSAAIILGGLYLIVMRIINPLVPVVFIGTVALGTWIGGVDVVYGVLSGGLLLGSFFMATDYSTTPSTKWGKVIFGFGCGVITVLIRVFGGYPEGVSYAILLMNILTPYISMWTRRKIFGGVKK